MKIVTFNKTGELKRVVNGESEWDGDLGYYEEIEVPTKEVKAYLADLLIDTYSTAEDSFSETERNKLIRILIGIIDDYDLLDKLKEEFEEELIKEIIL